MKNRKDPTVGDWHALVMGTRISRKMIRDAVREEEWYDLRKEMHGVPLPGRYGMLINWLNSHHWDERSRIQVSNYVNALKRAGMIPMEERE